MSHDKYLNAWYFIRDNIKDENRAKTLYSVVVDEVIKNPDSTEDQKRTIYDEVLKLTWISVKFELMDRMTKYNSISSNYFND